MGHPGTHVLAPGGGREKESAGSVFGWATPRVVLLMEISVPEWLASAKVEGSLEPWVPGALLAWGRTSLLPTMLGSNGCGDF